MKTEQWNGYDIRFVEVDGEWVAVAKDVSDALGYRDANSMTKKLKQEHLVYAKMADMNQKYLALTEFGIYKAIFGSHKPEAEQFQEWVFGVIKQLRKSSGLEGFEIFRMLDKEHQKQMMADLSHGLKQPKRVDFIKANMIANKAVSTKFGYSKMVKKGDMTHEMMLAREPILADTTQLMSVKDKFGLDIHVAETIYAKLGA